MSYSLEFIAHVILEKQSGNVPKGTKKKLQESCLSHVFCLRNLRDLRETYCFLCANCLSTLACYFPADSADHAEECSKLHYFAEKDRLGLVWFWVSSAIVCEICGRHWGFVCANCLSTLACYSPADYADHADEYSKAVLFRRERQIGVGVVLRSGYFVCVICEICGRLIVSFVQIV